MAGTDNTGADDSAELNKLEQQLREAAQIFDPPPSNDASTSSPTDGEQQS